MATQQETITEVFDGMGEEAPDKVKQKKEAPLYRVIPNTRIAVSRSLGQSWKSRYDAALAAYDEVRISWNEALRYYNNHQDKAAETAKGVFHRGDGTENLVYANVNTMLPAIYMKNPDITVNVEDGADRDFASCLEAFLNKLITRKQAPGINLKPKAKRAALFGELANMGVLKLEWIMKDESREEAQRQLAELTTELEEAKTQTDVHAIYGKLQALEASMEVFEPSGPKLSNIHPHNIIIDPSTQQADGSDANWMIEEAFLPTDYLVARFTQKDKEGNAVLVFKPTHKASFVPGEGDRDDGMNIVMTKLSASDSVDDEVTLGEDRAGYIYNNMTKVAYVWDKTTRRVYLFQAHDWTWPVWAWDDPLSLSRFFPYFFIQFSMGTQGPISVGNTSYYLDQQDEVNQINRKVAHIRDTVFSVLLYNTKNIDPDEASKLLGYISGKQKADQPIGIKGGANQKLSELIETLVPPSLEYEALFNKEPAYATIDRLGASSDALRGTQFKTNTTEDAVEAYMGAARLRVGVKTDMIEDVVGELVLALAELAVQFADQRMVEGLIGPHRAQHWKQMTVSQLNTEYSPEIVAGSVEKPTSVFKRKEAIQIAQAIGQYAQAAPTSTLTIVLRMLQNAFSEINIQPEDWDLIKQEMLTQSAKGDSTGGRGQPNSQPSGQVDSQPNGQQNEYMNVPPEVKQQAARMKQEGSSDQEIKTFLDQYIASTREQSNGTPSE